jgi:trehalose 6-phosphate phosphatase
MPNVVPALAADLAQLAILLDVDGSILDLADTPQSVNVPPTLPRTLKQLWRRTKGALAFVSGRRINDLDLIFAPLRLPAVGGHGAELRLDAASEAGLSGLPPLDPELRRRLHAMAEAVPGLVVEDKGYSLALHYRLAPGKGDLVRNLVEAICAGLSDRPVELLPGKSVLEVKQTGVDKASGVRALMMQPPFLGRRPIFVGGDVTDENVFAVMPEFGGIAISVGDSVSNAQYHFDHPSDVRRWLEDLSRNDCVAAP